MQIDNVNGVKASVLDMYMSHPYPNYTPEEREQIFAAELSRYRYLGLEHAMRGARVADIGCGTGHRVMPMAQHFGAKEYIGFDHSTESLKVAKQLSSDIGMPNVKLIEGDLFNLPLEDGSVDIVICQGVLHHTADPLRGFAELARICRPGGFINVYVYNKFNHLRHNMQKAKVSKLGGANIHKRFEVAHRLYGTKPVEEMTPAEIAGFYDQYCHPHKSDHTIGEMLDWFDSYKLEYWGAYPPLLLRDFIGMAQYRSELSTQYPFFHTNLSRGIIELASLLPRVTHRGPPFARPRLLDRFFWQSMYAIQGSRGRYSGGPSLSARKPMA